MRLNKYIAENSGLSRRQADDAILEGRVTVNDQPAKIGMQVKHGDEIKLNDKLLQPVPKTYLLLNKPVGYVSSRRSQGNAPTLYTLLPKNYKGLKTAGRLDKDSSGIILLTNDGEFAQKLTHPKYKKTKVYLVELDKDLDPKDKTMIEQGVEIGDGISKMKVIGSGKKLKVQLSEGKNRQIRRTFAKLGYEVVKLHRIKFGPFEISQLGDKRYLVLNPNDIRDNLKE